MFSTQETAETPNDMISGTRVTRTKDRPGSKTLINVCKLGVIRIISLEKGVQRQSVLTHLLN